MEGCPASQDTTAVHPQAHTFGCLRTAGLSLEPPKEEALCRGPLNTQSDKEQKVSPKLLQSPNSEDLVFHYNEPDTAGLSLPNQAPAP